MATWKKVITSGSDATLKSLTLDTDLAIVHGGTGASSATNARSNLGLGTAAVLNTAAIANGGTGVATADQIHTFVTGFGYTTAAGTVDTAGSPIDNDFAKFTDANTIEGRSASETRTDLGLGTAAVLSTAAIANGGTGVATADQIHTFVTGFGYTTATGTVDTSGSPVDDDFARFTDANTIEGRSASETRTDLGLGTAATTAASAYATATQGTKADNALVASTVSTYGAQLIDDANAGAARSTLGLGTAAVLSTSAIANGGTGVATADQIHTFVTGFGYTTAAGTVDTSGSPVDNDFAKFTDANTIEGRSASETRTDLGLGTAAVLDTAAISNGGTGVATADQIHTFVTTQTDAIDANTAGTAAGLSATLAVSSGGTGQTTLAAAAAALLNTNLGGALTIGDSNDTITFGEDVIVTGNLTVSGDTTTLDVTNLAVKDQFIELNDGGAAADAGIVVNLAANGSVTTAFGWDNSAGRWAFDNAGATVGQTSITSDAFVSSVVTSDVVAYRKNGNIRVESNEIYIYTE